VRDNQVAAVGGHTLRDVSDGVCDDDISAVEAVVGGFVGSTSSPSSVADRTGASGSVVRAAGVAAELGAGGVVMYISLRLGAGGSTGAVVGWAMDIVAGEDATGRSFNIGDCGGVTRLVVLARDTGVTAEPEIGEASVSDRIPSRVTKSIQRRDSTVAAGGADDGVWGGGGSVARTPEDGVGAGGSISGYLLSIIAHHFLTIEWSWDCRWFLTHNVSSARSNNSGKTSLGDKVAILLRSWEASLRSGALTWLRQLSFFLVTPTQNTDTSGSTLRSVWGFQRDVMMIFGFAIEIFMKSRAWMAYIQTFGAVLIV
jgi:hypothetical protein